MSWRQVLSVAFTDLRRVFRRRDTLVWLLLMPLPYTWFFGVAFHEEPAAKPALTVVAPHPDGGSRRVVAALEEAGYDLTVLGAWTDDEPLPAGGLRVDLPPELGAAILEGCTGEIALWSRGGSLEAERVRVVLAQAVLRLRGEALARLAAGERVGPETLGEPLQVVPVTVETAEWGERREVPSGFKQSIPGNMVMFVLMAVLVTGAVRLLTDREAGHLERMLAWPISTASVVTAQFLSIGFLGLVEAVYFLLLGRLFGLSPGPHPLAVLGVLALMVAAGSGLGVILGSTLTNARQAGALGILATLGLSALGGCWWPLEILPPAMKTLALALPTGQAMHALVRLMVWHDPPSALLGYVAYMGIFAAGSLALAASLLRRRLAG